MCSIHDNNGSEIQPERAESDNECVLVPRTQMRVYRLVATGILIAPLHRNAHFRHVIAMPVRKIEETYQG